MLELSRGEPQPLRRLHPIVILTQQSAENAEALQYLRRVNPHTGILVVQGVLRCFSCLTLWVFGALSVQGV